MSYTLIIKDGLGAVKNIQVDSGSNGYISNHSLVSTVTASNVTAYSPESGIDWSVNDGIVDALSLSTARKSVIINNNSETAKCYVIVGSNFGTIVDLDKPPPKYSFLLDSGATYFGDQSTAALSHKFFILSSSELTSSEALTVTVTEIY